eukprot:GHVN01060019.1.p1 GENE.GHVN01060019.1~~GHVN01060019.1.p1  ORF type:complete len:152 (+),score=13.02 GHVN01060019.1:807-1262(+)
MGLVGMISGLGGGFGGGALVDWVIRRWDKQTSLTFESRQASLACESVPKLESLVPICQLQTVLSIVGIVFLVVATTVVSRSLFFVTLTLGMSFIFGTQVGTIRSQSERIVTGWIISCFVAIGTCRMQEWSSGSQHHIASLVWVGGLHIGFC